ncbi:hypothetical protein SAMN02910447_03078 [Ruminococcus sp. YE71]|uniref:hypothetical protein n=1 Tax=Ruminococcus sp. YE71 TaxID=244362 RepID=UPI000908C415|nr:hypothetical protein [Ruminococcus sp. YE71]SFW48536.1 hypothetical protein SAMN02910447_03078 [Ruminococcus sp. YE71]
MSAKLIKLLVMILSDEKLRKKLIILVLSVAFGFIYLLCLPVVVFSNLGSVDLGTADIDLSQLTEDNFIASLDSEQAAELDALKSAGGSIEAEMAALGIADQTIKAQLIYVSFFDNVDDFNANSYANLFKTAPDDAALIDSINQNYGLVIDFEEYLHTYTFVMNNTINPYMFSDPTTKNAADLAAWANNAYVSGWGYKAGFTGEKDSEKRLRYCDNAGLMIGYLNYLPDSKSFGNGYNTLTFTEQGDLSTMPEVAGIGLYNGTKHGIYVGLGEVVFCDEAVGYVTKQAVSDGAWTSWCTYEGIGYPQAVLDKIDELAPSDDSSDDGSGDESEE